jgi:signal transduction histidine kinase
MIGYRFVPPAGSYYARIIGEKRAAFDPDSSRAIAEALGKTHATQAEPAAQTLQIEQRIGAPLIIQGQVAGILIVNGSGLREEDVPAIAGLANQAAIALENAHLTAEDQKQKEALRALSAQLVRTQEEERRRIARELHDETGQTLTAINLNLVNLIQELEPVYQASIARARGEPDVEMPSPVEATSQAMGLLTQTRALVEQTTRQIRELGLGLRPGILDDMGLISALRWHTNWFAEQYKIETRFRHRGLRERLPGEMETTLYRIAQEALTNVIRHAQAQNVLVYLERSSGHVKLVVEDDGAGFDAEAFWNVPPPTSTGLLGMQERARLMGGHLDIDSRPGEGTFLTAELPLEES